MRKLVSFLHEIGTIMYVGGILSHIVIGALFSHSDPETTIMVYTYKLQTTKCVHPDPAGSCFENPHGFGPMVCLSRAGMVDADQTGLHRISDDQCLRFPCADDAAVAGACRSVGSRWLTQPSIS